MGVGGSGGEVEVRVSGERRSNNEAKIIIGDGPGKVDMARCTVYGHQTCERQGDGEEGRERTWMREREEEKGRRKRNGNWRG